MGLWNAHTSVGNIGGSLVAAAALGSGWGWAFLVPGAALIAAAVLIWLLLAAEPEEAGIALEGSSELMVRILGLEDSCSCVMRWSVATAGCFWWQRRA